MSLQHAALICVLVVVAPETAQPCDYILKGGHVIDPANGIDRIMDIAVEGKTISRVAENIPVEQAKKAIDVAGY